MNRKKIWICVLLLVLIILLILNSLRVNLYFSYEHLTNASIEDRLNNLENKTNKLQATTNSLSTNKPKQFVTKQLTNILPPQINSNGTFLALGKLKNKEINGIMSRNNPTANSTSPPKMVEEGSFLGADQTWIYDKDGTIRNKWDSVNNQNGSCLYVLENTGKCSDKNITEKGDTGRVKCLQKNNTNKWMEQVGLIKGQPHKCAEWTWDAYGRILHNQTGISSNKKQCLVPLKTTTGTIIAGVETCLTNDLSDKHLWSFH